MRFLKLFLAGGLFLLGARASPAAQARLEPFLPTGHSDTVESVSLSRDGELLVTGSNDKTAILWEAASGRKLQAFRAESPIFSVALIPADEHIVGGCRHMETQGEPATGTHTQTLHGHKKC